MKLATFLLLSAAAMLACEPAAARTDPPELIPGPSPFAYPVELWDRGLEGDALLLVHVTALGDVDSVAVERSSGQPAFDSAAVTGARALRFSPARLGDQRIPAWTRVPVRFRTDTLSIGSEEDSEE